MGKIMKNKSGLELVTLQVKNKFRKIPLLVM